MKPEEAKPICECTLLGLEREGMTPAVHPDVVGVGIGYKRIRGFASQDLALKVYVRQKVHPLLVKDGRAIPDEVEGVPTDVEEAGEFSIWRPIPPIYQRKVRPAMGGISIGHYAISAGTLGCLVTSGGEKFILSNNHVLARLDTFVALDPDGTNIADAAIAQPFDERDVSPDILGIGKLRGSKDASLDEKVMKGGRTTRVTRGTVVDVSATVRVGYATGSFVFTDQMIIKGERSSFSAGGDSGSAIVSYDGRALGLLFAGSPFYTIANKMDNVQKALDVKVA